MPETSADGWHLRQMCVISKALITEMKQKYVSARMRIDNTDAAVFRQINQLCVIYIE